MRLTLTDRELDIMTMLWEYGPSTAADIRAQLSERGIDLARNTVQTILHILEEKGQVDHTEEGRAHRFRALVQQQAIGAHAVTRALDRLFNGSTEALVTHLVRERGLSQEELRNLRQLLDDELGPAPKGRAKPRTRP